MKFANFLSHDGNQYREKWRHENLRNLISSSLTFWDRCQLLRLVAIDTLFFTDSYSMYSAVYFLKSKEECLDKFKVFYAQVETPRAIRSDNGKEYVFKSFRSFCMSNRIKREHTVPYSPHQNGVSERG